MKEIAELSEGILLTALRSDDCPPQEKRRIAENLYVRFIPKDVNLGGQEGEPIRLTWEVNGVPYEITPEARGSVAGQKPV